MAVVMPLRRGLKWLQTISMTLHVEHSSVVLIRHHVVLTLCTFSMHHILYNPGPHPRKITPVLKYVIRGVEACDPPPYFGQTKSLM